MALLASCGSLPVEVTGAQGAPVQHTQHEEGGGVRVPESLLWAVAIAALGGSGGTIAISKLFGKRADTTEDA